MTDTPHTGGCRCGAVRFSASVAPHHISYCHCHDCRRAGGAPVSAFVGFKKEYVTFDGDTLKAFENGPVARSFCGVCGSPVAYVDDRLADDVWIALGAMDQPAAYKPSHHAYVREQLPFVHMPDSLPRHVKFSVPRPTEDTQ
ncbi:GFA family protein [Nitratireductor sp. CAU 1489]|uniref:GFA family protein n=1 Tax=Nitratireductor arenosus TaxID=2682096 RepID=A0A844QDY8_9HYPH|nr:GFA family protein [Nitratireductor arenosus]